MYEIKCTYEAIVPIMFNRYPIPPEPGYRAKKTKASIDWKEELKKKIWIDKNGVYIPADNIRMMLIGNQFRTGAAKILGSYIESGKGTEYLQMCKSCIFVIGTKDPLKIYAEPKRMTWDDVDIRSFVTSKKNRDTVARPIIKPPCTLSFLIQVVDDNIQPSKVKELFEVAGLRCGVSAYGPTFGRCIIKEWKTEKQ